MNVVYVARVDNEVYGVYVSQAAAVTGLLTSFLREGSFCRGKLRRDRHTADDIQMITSMTEAEFHDMIIRRVDGSQSKLEKALRDFNQEYEWSWGFEITSHPLQ
jgi:hypothetical protein